MPENTLKSAELPTKPADNDKTSSVEITTKEQVEAHPVPTTIVLKRLIVYNTSYGSLLYDAETQAYWVRCGDQFLCIHEVPKITITKDKARSFLKKCPTWTQAVEEIPKSFPDLKPTVHPIVSVAVLYYNAVQDSIVVTREKTNSGLAQFYLDKLKYPYIESIPAVLPFLRPEFVTGCQCQQLQTYGPVIYCPSCTTFRIQHIQQQTLMYKGISVVGKLTFYKPVADAIAQLFCSDKTTGKFVVGPTFQTCTGIFHLAGLQNIPIPQDIILGFVLRDSLFVRKFDDKVVSWSEYFKVKADSFGAGEALLLLRIGLAIGTLGAVS